MNSDLNNISVSEISEEDRLNAEIVAEAVLTSEYCWDVLNQMYFEACRSVLLTQTFINSVSKARDDLQKKLIDFIGFERSFETLLGDIRSVSLRLNNIYSLHKDCQGKPREDEWVNVFAYSQSYSILMDEIQTVIVPLITTLTNTMETALTQPDISDT